MLVVAAILFLAAATTFLVGVSEAIDAVGWRRVGWAACVVGSVGLVGLAVLVLATLPPPVPDI